jgi:hypothetical protein
VRSEGGGQLAVWGVIGGVEGAAHAAVVSGIFDAAGPVAPHASAGYRSQCLQRPRPRVQKGAGGVMVGAKAQQFVPHDVPIFVAAVLAPSEEAARAAIEAAYDKPGGALEWSFSNERADDWEPFCERFPRADWMQWP